MEARTVSLAATLAASLLALAWASPPDGHRAGPKGLVVVEDAPPGEALPAQTPPVGAIELEPGRQYPGGTRITSVADGVSFTVPDEWLGGLQPGAAAFMVGSDTRPGVGLIIMRAATTWQEIEGFLSQPQDLGHGVVLSPSSPGQRTARGYEIRLANALYAGHAIGRLGEAGNGVVVFFGGPAGQRDYYEQLTAGTAGSVAFAAPRESAAAQQWRSHLAGMMLRRQSAYYSGGQGGSYVGGSSSETLHLCSDGSYAYLAHSSVAADAGSGTSGYRGGDGTELGRWQVEAIGDRVLLSLHSAAGEVSQHALQVRGDATYVDGERAYRVRSDRCR